MYSSYTTQRIYIYIRVCVVYVKFRHLGSTKLWLLFPFYSCDQPDGDHVGSNILLIVWWTELLCSDRTYCVCVCVLAVTPNDNWSQVKSSRRAYLRSQLQLTVALPNISQTIPVATVSRAQRHQRTQIRLPVHSPGTLQKYLNVCRRST